MFRLAIFFSSVYTEKTKKLDFMTLTALAITSKLTIL